MNILSDKLAKSHTKRPEHGYKSENFWETEPLLITAQNHDIRTNLIKSKSIIRNRLASVDYVLIRDKTINHMIGEWEYKPRHGWEGKMISQELCKKLKFYHTAKRYLHKPESIPENKMHKILWDFQIQTDHLIPTRRPNLVIIYNK